MKSEHKIKIRDGFQGEKLISIPTSVLNKVLPRISSGQLYITHIGYFPKAKYHYRQRKNGCTDNILFYCLQGKGYYKLDGIKEELNANQFIIIPATCKSLSYWADQNDPWSIYWVHFSSNDLESFNQMLQINEQNKPLYIPHNETGLKIWNIMYENLSKDYSFENMINANFCLYQLIATFLYPQKHISVTSSSMESSMIEKTVEYMKNNIEKKIEVEDLASLNHLSASHFSKLFRTSTGMSPIDYFIHLKMQRACHLLYTTNLQIKQIAVLLGYEDVYYFSRLFKRNMNASPEKYRTSIKKIF